MPALHRRLLPLLLLCAAIAHPLSASLIAEPLVVGAEAAMMQTDDRRAETLLSQIPAGSLDAMQLARVQIVRAEIGVQRQSPQIVLRSLPAGSEHVPALAPRIELLRARAQFQLGDPVGAVRSLVQRERFLNDPAQVADNRDQIWNGLIATPIPISAMPMIPAQDPVSRGWLDLGLVLQQGPGELAIRSWSERYPAHPATPRLALIQTGEAVGTAVASIGQPLGQPGVLMAAPTPVGAGGYALLLPLSGGLASGARAIRDGLVAAWFELPQPRPPLRIYDTGPDRSSAVVALEAALREGSDFLIGPLTKDAVEVISNYPRANRPWLTLNYLDAAIPGAYQFGLAPEDEARAAAADALAAGHRRALVLAPDNEWGERVQVAFAQALTAGGGSVLQTVRYKQGLNDFGEPLKALMNLDQSNARNRAIKTALGSSTVEFDPRPRGDADMLFAPARSSEIRVLAPQLAFFRAQRLPTYTVAAAYTSAETRALEGLSVCDMPWTLARSGIWKEAHDRAAQMFPDSMRDQPRLYALGGDAMRIAQAMQHSGLDSTRPIDGATGQLRLDQGGHIQRELVCASFRDGQPQS